IRRDSGSEGQDDPVGEGDSRRLRGFAARQWRWRIRQCELPRDGRDVDGLGRCRSWRHRGRGGCAWLRHITVWPAMSVVIETKGLVKRYRGHVEIGRAHV